MDENREREYYIEKIVEMLKEIESVNILNKIHTVVKTHLRILKGEA